MKYSIKNEMFEKAINTKDNEELVLIKVSLFDKKSLDFGWFGEKEFRYKGQFYDVVKKKIVNDTLYYYCLDDKKETALSENLVKYIKINHDFNSPHQKKNQNIIKSLIKDAFPSKYALANILYGENFTFYDSYKNINYYFTLDIPSPPPKA